MTIDHPDAQLRHAPATAPAPSSTSTPTGPKNFEMPWFASAFMLLVCVAVSIADLAFLNDVIGQVLDVEFRTSMILSAVLGLVGLAFMAHLGQQEAGAPSDHISRTNIAVHLGIWLALGVLISTARLLSASILELGPEESTVEVFGLVIRQQDAIFAPIMLVMYVIAGIGARTATRDLFLNSGFHEWREVRKTQRHKMGLEKDEAKQAQMDRLAVQKGEAEKRRSEQAAKQGQVRAKKEADAEQKRLQRIEREGAEHQEKLETIRKKEELERERIDAKKKTEESEQAAQQVVKDRADKKKSYQNSLHSYLRLKSGFESRTQNVSDMIALIERLDAEIAATDSALTNAIRVIDESEVSTQNAAALKIHAKTEEPVAQLSAIIASHNSARAGTHQSDAS